MLYDANLTSSNGEASCSSCHIFGDMDDLGWDLGNPDDNVKTNSNGFNDQPFIDFSSASARASSRESLSSPAPAATSTRLKITAMNCAVNSAK